MHKQSLILLAVALTVGSFAHAAAMPPALLGEVNGILSYCESVDGRDGDKFEKLAKSFSQGLSRKDLESLQKDPSYRTKLIYDYLDPNEAGYVVLGRATYPPSARCSRRRGRPAQRHTGRTPDGS